jgi:hypothetical protein
VIAFVPLLFIAANEGFQTPGHKTETENEKALIPGGWKVLLA